MSSLLDRLKQAVEAVSPQSTRPNHGRNERRGAASRVSEDVKISGRIVKIIASNPPWHCLRVNSPDHGNITVVGDVIAPALEMPIVAWGKFEESRHGRQYKANLIAIERTRTRAGTLAYLRRFSGIGQKTAAAIVERFGDETYAVLDSQPERLSEIKVAGFNEARRMAFIREWREDPSNRFIYNLIDYLESNGVSVNTDIRMSQIKAAYRRYGEQVIGVLSSCPYELTKLEGFGFLTADRLATAFGLPRDSGERISAALLYVLKESEEIHGNTWTPSEDLVEKTAALLDQVSRQRIRSVLAEKIAEGAVEEKQGNVAIRSTAERERDLARLIVSMSAEPVGPGHLKPGDEQLSPAFAALNDEQKAAVLAALGIGCPARLLVLTGGPGTGKTTSVRAIIEIIRASGKKLDIALAAPTGKAAKRLEQLTGHPAHTVHKLLEYGYKDGRPGFKRSANNPISADFLIVDECSMIDLRLALSLFSAVPQRARVIMVGDVNQLPSPGPGAVMRDIIRSETVPVFRLSQIHRQVEGSGIIAAAHAIVAGKMPDWANAGDCRFSIVARKDNEDSASANRRIADAIIDRVLALNSQGVPFEEIQVLSPLKDGESGIRRLNERLREIINPDCGQPALRRFRVGDRVMQVSNDYSLEVFNGDQGSVTGVDPDGRFLVVDFISSLSSGGTRRVEVPLERTSNLILAYAITVHKSQGSEFPYVIMALSASHVFALNRNLVYTAATRAQEHLTMVGEPIALKRSLKQIQSGRLTGLLDSITAERDHAIGYGAQIAWQ